jgi:hypothetical protein
VICRWIWLPESRPIALRSPTSGTVSWASVGLRHTAAARTSLLPAGSSLPEWTSTNLTRSIPFISFLFFPSTCPAAPSLSVCSQNSLAVVWGAPLGCLQVHVVSQCNYYYHCYCYVVSLPHASPSNAVYLYGTIACPWPDFASQILYTWPENCNTNVGSDACHHSPCIRSICSILNVTFFWLMSLLAASHFFGLCCYSLLLADIMQLGSSAVTVWRQIHFGI